MFLQVSDEIVNWVIVENILNNPWALPFRKKEKEKEKKSEKTGMHFLSSQTILIRPKSYYFFPEIVESVFEASGMAPPPSSTHNHKASELIAMCFHFHCRIITHIYNCSHMAPMFYSLVLRQKEESVLNHEKWGTTETEWQGLKNVNQ